MKKLISSIIISLLLLFPISNVNSYSNNSLPAISTKTLPEHLANNLDKNYKYSIELHDWVIADPVQVIPKHISGLILVLMIIAIGGIVASIIHNKIIAIKTKEVRDTRNRFKSLFDQAPLSYQSIDKDSIIIEVNKTWLEIMGYAKDEVLGSRFSKFLNPNDKDHFDTLFPKLKAVGEILGEEFEMKKKDGNYITVAFHGKIAYDHKNNFKQTHCVFRDITEQKIIEAKLMRARKMESVGTLAAGISHDFSNILFIMMSTAQIMLVTTEKDTKEYDFLTNILNAGERGIELIKQILSFSCQSRREVTDIDIKPIIKEALVLSSTTIPENIKVTSDLDSSDEYIIQADSTQIHQVVLNLITNAYQAVGINGGEILIELKKEHLVDADLLGKDLKPGYYVRLTVSDEGYGMTSEILENIFDPYFTTKSDDRGTGLGLSVVYGIVTEYKGDIRVYSEPEKGTVFNVYLPLVNQDC